jgi:glycosyltransferase involved in cell wall biosynthesis
MPVALVEACAMGLPVVTTNVGGISDLIRNGETGLLVPDDDKEAAVAAINRLLMEPALAAHMSANGYRLAQDSSWQNVVVQWEQVFSEMFEVPAEMTRRAVV